MLVKYSVLLFVIGVVAAQHHHHSLMCLSCHNVHHRDDCTTYEACPGEACGLDVQQDANGQLSFHFHCKAPHDCDALAGPAVGKRQHHQPKVCSECCTTNQCSNTLCAAYTGVATTAAPIPGVTAAPSAFGDGCVDDDTFDCLLYDQQNFCTDTNAVVHAIALTKCPKHCGLCKKTPCENVEDPNFSCAFYDSFNFCTESDTSSLAYSLAHHRCRLHCGFCTVQPTDAAPATGEPVTTLPPPSPTPPASLEPQAASLLLTGGEPCVDIEMGGFSCAQWSSMGYCDPSGGPSFIISQQNCKKTCNLC